MKTNIKQWIKDHKYELITVSKAAMLGIYSYAVIAFVSKQAYGNGVRFGAAVSARASRKALDLSEDDIQKVIDMLPAAEKEILAEYGKRANHVWKA